MNFDGRRDGERRREGARRDIYVCGAAREGGKAVGCRVGRDVSVEERPYKYAAYR